MRIFLVLVLAGVAASVAFPVSSGPPSERAGEAGPPALPLQLSGQAAEGFLAGRASRFAVLRAAQGEDGPASPIDAGLADGLLDLAAFYLARGFVPEGLSVIASLRDASLDAGRDARLHLLEAALTALDPREGADLEAAADVLEASGGGAAGVLLAHAQQRMGLSGEAAETASRVMADVDALPDALAAIVLPQLLEAAVTAEDWALARGLAERLSLHRRAGDGAWPYLLGQVALGSGDLSAAFEYFVEAAAARDTWGHRARMAIVSLGREVGAVDDAQALSMLQTVYALWRGDAYAARTLLEIERVAQDAGMPLAAARALGELIARHGESPEAGIAAERAVTLIHAYYRDGIAGAVPLDDFLEGHREIAAWFRFLPGYADASEAFADHMLTVGATAAAAREYRLTREYLEMAGELGMDLPEPRRLDALRLKEAEARLDGGQEQAAEALLASPVLSENDELARRLALLRARFAVVTGRRPHEAELGSGPDSETFLRLVAEAYSAEGQWEEARSAYVSLWETIGDDMTDADAIGLLISAHRSGDADLVAEVEPLLARRGGAAAEAVISGFAPEPVVSTGLSADVARTLLQRAERAIELAGRTASGETSTEEPLQE